MNKFKEKYYLNNSTDGTQIWQKIMRVMYKRLIFGKEFYKGDIGGFQMGGKIIRFIVQKDQSAYNMEDK